MLQTHALSPTFGVEVLGLDIGVPISEAASASLRHLLATSYVLLIRDRTLGPDQQMAFAETFGTLDRRILEQLKRMNHPAGLAGASPVQHVSNLRADGVLQGGELSFHNDELFFAQPSHATILHAIEVPRIGGETLFVDVPTMMDRMTPAEAERLVGLHALHSFDYSETGNAGARPRDPTDAAVPRYIHPLVHRDPATGRASLWLSLSNTVRVIEEDPEASESTILELCDRIAASDLVYAHIWRPGDTLVWNNLMVQHARRDFPSDQARTLRRLTVGRGPVQ